MEITIHVPETVAEFLKEESGQHGKVQELAELILAEWTLRQKLIRKLVK